MSNLTLLDAAYMAGYAYIGTSNYVPTGWQVLGTQGYTLSGASATSFYNSTSNSLVVASAGTGSIPDWVDDFFNVIGGTASSHQGNSDSLLRMSLKALANSGVDNPNVYFVGHSLGGYISLGLGGKYSDAQVIVFNSPGYDGLAGNTSLYQLFASLFGGDYSNVTMVYSEDWGLAYPIHGLGYHVGKIIYVPGASGHSLADLIAALEAQANLPRCFPASTPILTSLTSATPISDLRVGDVVLAFDPHTELGRGGLVPRRVTKLYRNATTEWVRLSWVEDGEARELAATPGHHMLDQFGNFPPLEQMIRDGAATVVLASGELAEVRAERIAWSAQTADLFEQASAVAMAAGNTSPKPQMLDAWTTYNFEVEGLHTYVAGGVRVHNISLFMSDPDTLGSLADNISGQISNHIFGANTLGSALAGAALSSATSTFADALEGRASFNAAHLGGRFLYGVAGGLGAAGGNLLMQDLISGLGIRGSASNTAVKFQRLDVWIATNFDGTNDNVSTQRIAA
jgi:hypothetical protein